LYKYALSEETANMRKHPLVYFFLLTFAITWGLAGLYFMLPNLFTSLFGPISAHNPIFILAVWAPTISGFILSAVTTRKSGVVGLLKRFVPARVGIGWYLLVTLVVPAAGILISVITRKVMPLQTMSVTSLLSFLFINLITGPLGEEFGWRGFALPRLLVRHKAVLAGLILGLIWALWHLPSFLISGTPQSNLQLPYFILAALALSVIITWVLIHAKQSIFLSFLFHYMVNFTLSVISGALMQISLVLTAFAIFIVALSGWDLGKPKIAIDSPTRLSPE
jgi:membrane protease YdiL (CAAX protease family)